MTGNWHGLASAAIFSCSALAMASAGSGRYVSAATPRNGHPSLQWATVLGHHSERGVGIGADGFGNVYAIVLGPHTRGSQAPPSFVEKLDKSGTRILYRKEVAANLGGIAVDRAGNAYVTGSINSGSHLLTAGSYQSRVIGQHDALVAKLNPSGKVIYATALGRGKDGATAIAIDRAGDAYVTGDSGSPDFPLVNPVPGGHVEYESYTPFVAELNAKGSRLIYSTLLGPGYDPGGGTEGIAVDRSEAAYVVGFTFSPEFPVTSGALQPSSRIPVGGSPFLTKIAPRGGKLVYSTYLGGPSGADTNGVAVDSKGNAYVAGSAGPKDLPQAHIFRSNVTGDGSLGFVAKVNSTGSRLLYSAFLGGRDPGLDFGGLAVDRHGNAYVAGQTTDRQFPTRKALQRHLGSGICPRNINDHSTRCPSAFVAKINPAGNGLVYSTYLGGDRDTEAYAIAIDSHGAAFITGITGGHFPHARVKRNNNPGGLVMAFLAKIG